jgi:hypothetical protein
LGGWWCTALHCSKRRNENWICQKCKKKKVNFIIIHLFYFQLWNPSYAYKHNLISSLKFVANKRFFSQKIIFKWGGLHILKALAFDSCPFPLFPHSPLFNWPLWGLKFHLLGGRERS